MPDDKSKVGEPDRSKVAKDPPFGERLSGVSAYETNLAG